MIKLENWNEVTRGLYRYVISAVLLNGPLAACLQKAVEDEKEMRG